MLGWTDPLHLVRRVLRKAVAERLHYTQGRLLDLGCGERPYSDLFPHVELYVALDIAPYGDVDVCANAEALPFRDGAFDTVLCTELLEHVPEPSRVLAEVSRVLQAGGHLLLTSPQTWGLHGEPYDYYRYTCYGLRYQAERSGLEVMEVAPTSGLWGTTAQRVADTAVYTYAARWPRWAAELLSLLVAPLLLLGAGLDGMAGKRGDTLGNVLVARKPPSAELWSEVRERTIGSSSE